MWWIKIATVCFIGINDQSTLLKYILGQDPHSIRNYIDAPVCIQTAEISTSPITAKPGESIYVTASEELMDIIRGQMKGLKFSLQKCESERETWEAIAEKLQKESEERELRSRGSNAIDNPYPEPTIESLEARIIKLEKCGCGGTIPSLGGTKDCPTCVKNELYWKNRVYRNEKKP